MGIFKMTPYEWIYVIVFVVILVFALFFLKRQGPKIMDETKDKK